ncbi:MAG TPA: SPFH domain-containing protein [Candidatus Lokiarchaeia archaeon]
MYKKVKEKEVEDSSPEILAWSREDKGYLQTPIMYIFPQSGDEIKDKKFFIIKDYEKALFYNKGELVGVLTGGLYQIDKKARIKGTEIVYIDISLIEIPWGIPQIKGIPTKDGYIVGLYGDLKLRINDVKVFYNDIVAGTKIWTIQDLKDWITSLLHTSLRDIFKKYNAKNIMLENREKVINLVSTKIKEEFVKYGLVLDTFNVIGIKTAENVEKLFEEEKEKLLYLNTQKNSILQRIKELKDKLNELQNLLLDDKLTKMEYEKKKQLIQIFIEESEEELRKLKINLEDFSKDESSITNSSKIIENKLKICKYCGKEIDEDSKICSYCGNDLEI